MNQDKNLNTAEQSFMFFQYLKLLPLGKGSIFLSIYTYETYKVAFLKSMDYAKNKLT